MRYNHLVDVTFSVEGPWENFEDIPYSAFIDGLMARLTELRTEGDGDLDALWDCCNVYETEKEKHGNTDNSQQD